MTTVVSVAVYGREPTIHVAVNEKMLPEFDVKKTTVVHSCTNLSSAKAELSPLCLGNSSINPSSGIGSNVKLPVSQRKIPKFVLFGSTIPDHEVEQVTEAIKEKAPSVGIIRSSPADMRKAGAVGPDIDIIVMVFKDKLAKEL
ncbi:hypothetical protein BS50DRAFT_621537 [Corynespora cassiicola Philippines]|uniref:Uncharacterized protein n=1 Tax=Corynespora cassiicola Philippines TaxID=1448308 RepID=A0A2T2NJT9_CORCC|nr:hypothetical protein BS50DRAFT_621537 [Corynespora cassiicola Philippines]